MNPYLIAWGAILGLATVTGIAYAAGKVADFLAQDPFVVDFGDEDDTEVEEAA